MHAYLVHCSCVSVEQNSHTVINNLDSFFFSQCILSSFHSFSKDRLCKVGTETRCNRRVLVCRSFQVNVSEESTNQDR